MSIKKYYLATPEKLTTKIAEWEAVPPFKGFHIDDLRLLLTIIATHQRKDENGDICAHLVMELLRKRVWHAERYIRFLKKEGVITIGRYILRETAYRYQFTPAYQSPYLITELHNAKLLKRINKIQAAKGRQDSRKYPKQNQQIKSMEIDFQNAVEIVRKEFMIHQNVSKMNNALGSIVRINNQEFYIKVDPTGNRVHTNLTGLKKTLRGQVKIMGKRISAGVDIRNSQPYISSKVLSDPDSVKEFFPGKFPLMRLKCLRLSEQHDVTLYHLLTSNARFYKFLETEFNKRGCHYIVQEDPTKVSQELKDKVMQILNDRNEHTSKEKEIFHELFPGVNRAFSLLREENYKYFNMFLTRLESHLVNDVIIQRLNTDFPDMVATPIYDNVCTTADGIETKIATDNVGRVCQVMKEELTKFTGMRPSLKIEDYDRALF